ncbi:MAG TPA: multidrug efflux SMR transporter [Nocardioidaceae bacterium]
MIWLLLAAAILSEVTATLSLKAALNHHLLYVVVAVGYCASFVLLALVLRRGMALGVAYGIWSAVGVAATALLSALIFDEALTTVMVIGLGLVVCGMLLVELGSHPSRPGPPTRDGRRT